MLVVLGGLLEERGREWRLRRRRPRRDPAGSGARARAPAPPWPDRCGRPRSCGSRLPRPDRSRTSRRGAARSAGRGRRAPSGSRATRRGRRMCARAARAADGRRARPRRRGRGRPQARSARPRVRPGRPRPARAARGASQSVWSTPTVRGPTRSGVAISVRTPRPLRSGPASSSVGSWMTTGAPAATGPAAEGSSAGTRRPRPAVLSSPLVARTVSRWPSGSIRSTAAASDPSSCRRSARISSSRSSRSTCASAASDRRCSRWAASARSRASRRRMLLSTATAVRRASSSATAMSSGLNGGRSPQARSNIAPSVRPRAASGRITAERASISRTTSMWRAAAQAVAQDLVGQLGQDLGAALAQRGRHVHAVGVGREGAQPLGHRRAGPVGVGHRHPAHAALLVEQVDRAHLGEPRCRQPRDALKAGLGVERPGQHLARLQQQLEPHLGGRGVLVAGVLERDRECARAAALGIADRGAHDVDADARRRPCARRAPLRARRRPPGSGSTARRRSSSAVCPTTSAAPYPNSRSAWRFQVTISAVAVGDDDRRRRLLDQIRARDAREGDLGAGHVPVPADGIR